eukprot:GSChrysophyteH1.ASY1.ANO1.3200.1 assembled CDS
MGKRGKQRSDDKPRGGGAGRRFHIDQSGGNSRKRGEMVYRSQSDIIESELGVGGGDEDGDGESEGDSEYLDSTKELEVNICMWEFGQNDTKRDSGSKLCRLGYAGVLRIVSKEDREIVQQHGISGINCSWNRLDEIPFDKLGRGRNQRLLPLLLAANTVNYGKPFKMNTAEAMAACLYITGFQTDARTILAPFSYGSEFLRLNAEALNAYAACDTAADVTAIQQRLLDAAAEKESAKMLRLEQEASFREENGGYGGYMDDMDLPPQDDYAADAGGFYVDVSEGEEAEEEEEEEEEEEVEEENVSEFCGLEKEPPTNLDSTELSEGTVFSIKNHT